MTTVVQITNLGSEPVTDVSWRLVVDEGAEWLYTYGPNVNCRYGFADGARLAYGSEEFCDTSGMVLLPGKSYSVLDLVLLAPGAKSGDRFDFRITWWAGPGAREVSAALERLSGMHGLSKGINSPRPMQDGTAPATPAAAGTQQTGTLLVGEQPPTTTEPSPGATTAPGGVAAPGTDGGSGGGLPITGTDTTLSARSCSPAGCSHSSRPVGGAPDSPPRVHPMLVWLASFPRSGNTFLRIVLSRLYGVSSSVIYDLDGVAERLGPELIGAIDRPATLDAMRAAAEVHLIKTHRPRDQDVHDNDGAICLVRDGRDALVSWARQTSEKPDRVFRTELESAIAGTRGTRGWGTNVLSWLDPPAPHRVQVRYDDLVRDPTGTATHIVTALDLPWRRRADATVPSFAELHATDPAFFRRGRTGTHRDELPADLHESFWSHPDNAAAMTLLGYPGRPTG